MRVKLGISGIFHNEANRGDRQAAPALSMRQRGDLVGGIALANMLLYQLE